jgi:hypothetical protein
MDVANTIPTPTLPLKGRELTMRPQAKALPLKGREQKMSPCRELYESLTQKPSPSRGGLGGDGVWPPSRGGLGGDGVQKLHIGATH